MAEPRVPDEMSLIRPAWGLEVVPSFLIALAAPLSLIDRVSGGGGGRHA